MCKPQAPLHVAWSTAWEQFGPGRIYMWVRWEQTAELSCLARWMNHTLAVTSQNWAKMPIKMMSGQGRSEQLQVWNFVVKDWVHYGAVMKILADWCSEMFGGWVKTGGVAFSANASKGALFAEVLGTIWNGSGWFEHVLGANTLNLVHMKDFLMVSERGLGLCKLIVPSF